MTALEQLAARCGIAPQFVDARGTVRHISAAARARVLAAMGVHAVDEAQAQAALQLWDHAEWTQALPPVCVVDGTVQPLAIEINVPVGTGSITWQLTLESGRQLRATARIDALECVAGRVFDEAGYERRRLPLGDNIDFGYHRLEIDGWERAMTLIVTPSRCWLPRQIVDGQRLWGIAAQLYLLRSAEDWGIGDFGHLRTLAELVRARGGDVVGLNPLHALFLDAPEQASPYSPASRLLLNVLNIDVAALPELLRSTRARLLIDSPAFAAALRRCRAAALVDYAGVLNLKLPVLRLLFEGAKDDRTTARWSAFAAFREQRGGILRRHSVFDVLRQEFVKRGQAADWRRWPEEFRDPDSAAVQRFAEEHADEVLFREWLEFAADAQLAEAAAAAAGMAIGLYRDLAVGADPAGAETWANRDAVIVDAAVGAPPDIYNPTGQNWGLPPFSPRALREQAYRSFIDLVRANMRHAGGLRIDHVMALQQLYWVPSGHAPDDGAYVHYPLDDLLGILALESQRHRCVVVGEDLGTVPDGFRERMAAAQVLSYRVLLFERDAQAYLAPERYPVLALAVSGSHDLPTLHAWWEASDLQLKERLHLFPTAQDRERAWAERGRDRRDLVAAFGAAGFELAENAPLGDVLRTAQAFLARTRCALALLQVDDISDETTPVNVPTTGDEHPNWRRRLSLTLAQLAEHPRFHELTGLFDAARAGGKATAAAP